MRNDEVSQSDLKRLLRYDPETGVFTWLVKPWKGRVNVGDTAGTVRPDGYVIIRIAQRRYRAHRLAFLYMTGEMPPSEVDHIDGNRGNNAWLNLRPAEPFENQQNKSIRRDNKSGYAGVSRYRNGGWQAHIKLQGRNIYLGRFKTPEAARDAYNNAKSKMHTFAPEVRQ